MSMYLSMINTVMMLVYGHGTGDYQRAHSGGFHWLMPGSQLKNDGSDAWRVGLAVYTGGAAV